MLMSAVSAEENITIDDGSDLASDYIELGSDQSYNENDIDDNPLPEDNVVVDENISEDSIKQDTYQRPLDENDASSDYGFKGMTYASASLNKNFAVQKPSSSSLYSEGDDADVKDDECSVDGKHSNSQSPDVMCAEALKDIPAENLFAQTYSSYREYFDYLNLDSLEHLLEENKIGDVFNANSHIIDFANLDSLKHDLIKFMGAGAKYVDYSMNLIDVDAFLDIFDKFMNFPSTHDVMANIPSSNYNPMLRNHKDYSNYSDYSFYPDADLIINSYDLDDEMELFMESDSNISDMLIIQDNTALINQTSDLNTMPDVCIDSYDMKSDLQLSDDTGCLRDAQDNSDKTAEIQSFKFIQQINCLPSNISEDIQHNSHHMIGCECTNTSFTKQHNSYENLPKVSEFDTIASAEQEDNHDHVLFKKYNVDSPFIVENTSIFALFGVIEITIP